MNINSFSNFILRAKELLYVIGNKKLLTRDDIWASFIEYCELNGLMIQSEKSENFQKDERKTPPDTSELLD